MKRLTGAKTWLIFSALLLTGLMAVTYHCVYRHDAQLSDTYQQTLQNQSKTAPAACEKLESKQNSTASDAKKSITAPEYSFPAHADAKADQEVADLTVKGDAVKEVKHYSIAQLKAMPEGYCEQVYSAVNNLPMPKFFIGKGIRITYLLQQAGIKDNAKSIVFEASDGYKKKFTIQQIITPLYYFPELMSNSSTGAAKVPAILAWEHKEGCSEIAKAEPGQLRLLMGQENLQEITAPNLVKYVNSIEVLSE